MGITFHCYTTRVRLRVCANVPTHNHNKLTIHKQGTPDSTNTIICVGKRITHDSYTFNGATPIVSSTLSLTESGIELPLFISSSSVRLSLPII